MDDKFFVNKVMSMFHNEKYVLFERVSCLFASFIKNSHNNASVVQ